MALYSVPAARNNLCEAPLEELRDDLSRLLESLQNVQ
jgi:hypothetical protein